MLVLLLCVVQESVSCLCEQRTPLRGSRKPAQSAAVWNGSWRQCRVLQWHCLADRECRCLQVCTVSVVCHRLTASPSSPPAPSPPCPLPPLPPLSILEVLQAESRLMEGLASLGLSTSDAHSVVQTSVHSQTQSFAVDMRSDSVVVCLWPRSQALPPSPQ